VSGAAALERIVAALDRAEIPHMLAGSFASTLHGIPRSTHDIDLVVDPTPPKLDALLRGLPRDRFYVSAEAARDAIARRSSFNVIDLASAWKIDLIVRRDRPFSKAEFARRQATEILGVRVFAATAEDTIVAKLEWARLGESERQLRDVAGVIEMSGAALDRGYIERWVSELRVGDLWERAQQMAAGR
jgi:hypothetical protein